jgi:hypothetical protein
MCNHEPININDQFQEYFLDQALIGGFLISPFEPLKEPKYNTWVKIAAWVIVLPVVFCRIHSRHHRRKQYVTVDELISFAISVVVTIILVLLIQSKK